MKKTVQVAWTFACFAGSLAAEEPAAIRKTAGNGWKLHNEVVSLAIKFKDGRLTLRSLANLQAKVDYLEGQPSVPLFSHVIDGGMVTADDGCWTLVGASVSDIECYGKKWGQRLEISLSRSKPVPILTRQVFEIYDGRAAVRYSSWVKNQTDHKMTIQATDVLSLNLPDNPHTLYAIGGVLNWMASSGGLTNGGRNAMVRYDTGDGWFIIPENNWATCLEPGRAKAHSKDKLLGIFAWDGAKTVRVVTNPKAVQLVLFPQEEVEYFAVNLGVFTGDAMDGRMAAAEHLRQRYKFHDTSHILSVNDWQWGGCGGKRTDANYRNIVIPKWDQVDAGLLWKTDQETAYSHPGDSVYRKILGMRRYMNTIAHQHPDFIMQTTCEVDNPAGPGAGDSHGNQNIGLIVAKPAKKGVEMRQVTLDAAGGGVATFDSTTLTASAGSKFTASSLRGYGARFSIRSHVSRASGLRSGPG